MSLRSRICGCVLSLAFAMVAIGQPVCPSKGSCCEAHGGLGCDNAECCSIVCGMDPFCCDTSWDGICAAEAADFCGCGACCSCFGSQHSCTLQTEADCEALGGSHAGPGTSCLPPGAIAETSSPGLAIPDDDPAGVSDSIEIFDGLTISAISVRIQITHTWVGDLCVSLSKDGGTPELLMSRIGADTGGNTCHDGSPFGCSEDNLDVIFDEAAGESIETQCEENLTNYFLPDPGSLSAFTGMTASGTWTLHVSDDAGGDIGTLDSWTLTLSHGNGLTTCEKSFPNLCGSYCPWDCGNFNGDVDTADFLALIGSWGQAGVPCDFGAGLVGVDTADFLQLLGHWGPCQAPGAGDCCDANGTIGCENVACERAVCAIDPFCCDAEWDGICADEARDFPVCGCGCVGDCGVAEATEAEPCPEDGYVDEVNGGCNSTPPVFTSAACTTSFCGTGSTFFNGRDMRDTDWYLVDLPDPDGNGFEQLRGRLRSEFDGVCYIIDLGKDCVPTIMGELGSSSGCAPVADAVACLPAPGTYAVFVAPAVFSGVPCADGSNDYTLEITCGGCEPAAASASLGVEASARLLRAAE